MIMSLELSFNYICALLVLLMHADEVCDTEELKRHSVK